ncbi:hypothetical protein NC652_009904 [Populus alba x Populus x berolinensis]|nr:hypothetical protein NC652_009904 [Populus alba x Populus x berolinensis]
MLQNFKVSRQNMRRFGYITYKIITFPYKNLPDGKTSNETKLHLSLEKHNG